jgi:hypothetical protein
MVVVVITPSEWVCCDKCDRHVPNVVSQHQLTATSCERQTVSKER